MSQLEFAFEEMPLPPPRPYKRVLYYSICAYNVERRVWVQSSTCATNDAEGVRKAEIQFDGPEWIEHCAWETGSRGFVPMPAPFGFDDDDFEFTFNDPDEEEFDFEEDDDEDFTFNFE